MKIITVSSPTSEVVKPLSSISDLIHAFKVEKPSQAEVIDLLNNLNKGNNGVEAYVAGGYLRDIENGIQPKDADIFVCPTDLHTIYNEETVCISYERVTDLTRNFKRRQMRSFHPNYEGGVMRPDVSYVVKYGGAYDVVVMHTGIEETIRNFDMSICQIYGYVLDGELVVTNTHQYEDYKTNKIIWQYEDIATTDDHIERVKVKFPDAEFRKMQSVDVTFIDRPRKIGGSPL